MFRGLDVDRGDGRTRVPILVADRPTFDVTLYVRGDADDERRDELRERLRQLADAGIVESVGTLPWSASSPPARSDRARPETFAVAIRREGTLVGWYPRRGTDTLEDGLSALCTGEGVENVRATAKNWDRDPTRQSVSTDSRPRYSPFEP